MSPRQFVAIARRHDVKTEQDDLRMAILAHVIYAVHRTEKMPQRSVQDFMPRRRQKTPQQLLRTVEMINLAMGGKDLRAKNGVRGLDREPVR